jgi:hypothetical protein
MTNFPLDPDAADPVRLLVEEILRTGLMLTGLAADLIEATPDDAFPGEDAAEVILEMLIGTMRPAAEAAGIDTITAATALLGALSDRTLADLKEAARRARAA